MKISIIEKAPIMTMIGIAKLIGYTGGWVCLSFFIFTNTAAQSHCKTVQDTLLNQTVYTTVDKQPYYKAGYQQFIYSIMKHLKLDPKFEEITGTVYMTFVVQKDGRINGIRVSRDIQSTHGYYSDQLTSILKKYKWKPALCNNKPVAALFTVPFRINILAE
jgi:hypothetical protein